MKAIRNVLYRYRLIASTLALVVLLGALVVTPAAADVAPICDTGCWDWNQDTGCVKCMTCCVYDDHHYSCMQVENGSCP
jgi:hypothetical protein